jgi:hypothetical protein
MKLRGVLTFGALFIFAVTYSIWLLCPYKGEVQEVVSGIMWISTISFLGFYNSYRILKEYK